MSQILENIGRSVTGVGSPHPEIDAARVDRGKKLIQQLVGGGLLVGGGAGLGVALANLVSSLGKEQEIYEPSNLNSGTLYVPLPGDKDKHEKQASMLPYLAPGIALAGGATGAMLGYSAAQQLWVKIQNARRKALLEEAQSDALAAADQELGKQAGAQFNLSDTMLGVPVATALLSALASGGITMAALNKTFPVLHHPRNLRPKRVRLVTPEGEQIPVSQDAMKEIDAPDENREVGYIKEASFGDFEAAGREFTTSLVSRMRPAGLTSAILNMVARRGVDELATVVKSAGVAVIPDVTKGWESKEVGVRDRQLAAMALHKHAYMSEVAHSLAVQELLDAAPHVISHAVGSADPDRMRKCADLASLLGLASRQQYLPEYAQQDDEQAPENAAPQDYQRALEGQTKKEEADAGLNSDVGGTLATSEANDDNQEASSDDDNLDSLMLGREPMSVK